MTDDFGPLRQAMSDLAEHGGSTDLYERALHKSRRSQRRTAVATSAAAAVAVFAVGGAIAFAGRAGPRAPVATRPPAPSAAPTSAATTAPSPTPPSSTPPSSPSSTPSSVRTSDRPRYPACPSAKALEKLADLPKGWYFVPSSVECWKGWATADPEGPTPGDGIYLFQYKAGKGWRYHSQGSGYHCAELGITSGNPPFCQVD
ncbi:hypothetical protein ACFQFC_12910 [Amorphoplanes digitatis]|uniref:Uncharacterized protein n=1 Tax=Actinoplanes digitatis TaxID=1868 RepID=A0A7W7I269_9ACTN|nr:hypothetical protein [Actinoplanes digitatis]MBB4765103.1 hypothetical protein [Actinoplanes digitatis]GID97668.1 hypothetical protein Adi01nite_70800 [Actinoplanes digitatis]